MMEAIMVVTATERESPSGRERVWLGVNNSTTAGHTGKVGREAGPAAEMSSTEATTHMAAAHVTTAHVTTAAHMAAAATMSGHGSTARSERHGGNRRKHHFTHLHFLSVVTGARQPNIAESTSPTTDESGLRKSKRCCGSAPQRGHDDESKIRTI